MTPFSLFFGVWSVRPRDLSVYAPPPVLLFTPLARPICDGTAPVDHAFWQPIGPAARERGVTRFLDAVRRSVGLDAVAEYPDDLASFARETLHDAAGWLRVEKDRSLYPRLLPVTPTEAAAILRGARVQAVRAAASALGLTVDGASS